MSQEDTVPRGPIEALERGKIQLNWELGSILEFKDLVQRGINFRQQ